MLIKLDEKDPKKQLKKAAQGVIDQVRRNGVTDDYEGEQKENIQEFFYKGFFIGAYKIQGELWMAWGREKKGLGLIYVPNNGSTYIEFKSGLRGGRNLAIQEVQRAIDIYTKGK